MMSEAGVAPGGRVVGRYVLYDELASGGMATVHIGRLVAEAGFSRSVAIKRLHAQFAHDPEFVAMFLEEARLAARIRHPNVVPVLDVVSIDSELFLVMDYIQGETLTRLTRVSRNKNRIIPMNIALAIAADMLAGLHAAHEAKDENGKPLHIVHRDISPHNVMVGHDGVARVLDFGIAKASSSAQSTRDGEVRGKFAYMSPEQLASVPVDRRADVFAASIVLWEMLTGRRLFAANDPAGIVGKVLHGKIEPPGVVAGGLPEELDALVMKGLERDVSMRFSSAQEMGRALENLRLGIARPTEVGQWVDRIAGDTLKRRARRIAEIESTGSFSRSEALIPAAAVSGSLPESTSSRSQSGLRQRNDPVFQTPPSVDDSQPIEVVDSTMEQAEPARSRSRTGVVLVTLVALILGAGGVFVWRSGGLAGARAKVARVLNPSAVGTSMGVTSTAPSASVAARAASSQLSVAQGSVIDVTDGTARPGFRFHSKNPAQQRNNNAASGGGDSPGNANDPKLTTTLVQAAGGSSGDLGDAIKAAGGGGIGVGQGAIQGHDGPQVGAARPSQGQVQVAVSSVMPNVRSCLLGDDPASRALLTFQGDGTVKSVSVSGFAAGKPQEACIKAALSRAHVSPFTDPTYAVPVTIRP